VKDVTPASDVGFRPPAWLRNPHLQSVLPSLMLRRPFVQRRARELLAAAEPLLLDCGDGVRLLARHSTQERAGRPPARRIVMLLHGWEGSSDSMYVLSLGQYLFDRGFDVVRLNLRDHGGTHGLNREIFHSCRIQEVVGAVCRMQELQPGKGLNLVGFSLGGNFWLRVGARAPQAGIRLEQIVAVCPVLDPQRTLEVLENGWAIYRRYFVTKWRASLRSKQEAWSGHYDFSDVMQLETLTEMTGHLVCRYGGYPSLETYLRGYAVVGEVLATLEAPTRIIAAVDDPIIPAADLDRLPRLANLSISRIRFGGHCGFFGVAGSADWLQREVASTLPRGR
jgi:predicted alpha/beta-fold hydrolase